MRYDIRIYLGHTILALSQLKQRQLKVQLVSGEILGDKTYEVRIISPTAARPCLLTREC